MADDITNKVLLEHMHSMQKAMRREMKKMKMELITKIRGVELNLTSEMDTRFAKVDTALQRLYEKRTHLTARVDHIEEHIGLAA